MSFENEENKKRRERFVTCSEETLEEMENYVDNKFIRAGLKEKKNSFSFNMDGLNSKDTPDIPEDVVFPSDGGQEIPHQKVPEKELEKEEDEENEKTVKTTPGLDNDEKKEDKNEDMSDKNNKPTKKGKRLRSPNKGPSIQPSPVRKRRRKPKLPTKILVAPALPTFRTSRNLKAVRYVNRVTRKQIPSDIHKRNRVCIDCKNTEVEECLMCGKEEHICDMGVEMKIQADYVWLWVCLDCLDIATDDIAMKNVRELVDKEKRKKKLKRIHVIFAHV